MNLVIHLGSKDLEKEKVWELLNQIFEITSVAPAAITPAPLPAHEGESAAALPAAAPQEEAAPATEAVTVEEVRAALAKVSRKYGAERAKEILTAHGAAKVTALAPADYAAVKVEAEEAL